MSRHRTRRLRKTLHVGEFRQLGFEPSFCMAGAVAIGRTVKARHRDAH